RVVQRFHRNTLADQGALHQLAVGNRRALIFTASGEEYRYLDPVSHVGRRYRRQPGTLANPFAQIGLAGAVPLDVTVGVHGRQVVHTDVADRAAVQIRFLGEAQQRRVRAVAGTVNADAPGIGDTLLDRPAGGIGEVVLHRLAPLALAGADEGLAVAAGAAEVQLQHRIAGIGEQLRAGIEAPGVLNAERATVRVHHHRQLRLALALGQGQVTVELQPVACLQLDRTPFGHLQRVEPLTLAQQVVGLLGLPVEDEI